TGILAVGLMTGGLWAQNPNVINNVQNTSQAVQPTKTTPSATPAAKPAPGATAKPGAVMPVAAPAKGGAAPAAPVAKAADASKSAEAPKAPKPEEKKWAMSGKRDPFFSPVVQQPTGSGCSTGKKCLEIGQ